MSFVRIIFCFRHCKLTALPSTFVAMLMMSPLNAQIGSSGSASSLSTSSAPSSISGQVINAATGLPVARALVRFNDRAVLTGHDGKFEFLQNTEASGNILIVKPGFSSASDPSDTLNTYLQGSQLTTSLRLLLYPEAVLTGTVLAPDGTPLQAIPVSARRSTYDESGHRTIPAAQTQTDSHGNFRLPVSPGSYRIETQYVARDKNNGLSILPVTVPMETSTNTLSEIHVLPGEEQHFDLHPGGGQTYTITATMDAPSQHDMGPVRVSARSRNGTTFQVNLAFSGSTGEIKIELPRGSYTLVGRRNNPGSPEQAETPITVPDHDVSGVVLHFSAIPAIPVDLSVDEGSTSDNAPPLLSQLNLTLQNDQPDLDQNSASIRLTPFSNQNFGFIAPPGNYHLQERGSGGWYIKSISAGASDLLQQGLVVAPGSAGTPIRIMVSNQTGSLQGNVKLDGVPSACWVYLIATSPSAQPILSVRSNAEGGYTSPLPPGSYQAIAFERRHSINYADPASLARFASHAHSVTINAGEKTSLDLDAVSSTELFP